MKINQLMSDSEKELMKIIWDSDGSVFFAQILEKTEEAGYGWKRTTVLTFLSRLAEKGFIRIEKHGRINKYIATLTENDYLEQQTNDFINNVYGGNLKNLVSNLLRKNNITDEDFEEIKSFWENGGDKDE